MYDGTDFGRASLSELDLCAPGQVLLFLKETSDPDLFQVGYQGWVRIDGDLVQAAAINDMFDVYSSAQALVADVRQIGEEQRAQGILEGRLLCEWKRTSDAWQDPIVCPGDTFNPYQAFRLASAVSEASVVPTDPGPSPLSPGGVDLPPGSAQLHGLLAALDVQVTLEPEGPEPDDLIMLSIVPVQPVGNRDNFLFEYSPSIGIIRLSHSGGQFPAPPAFQQAMEPFLAPAAVE
jgi:hypothetical protein